MSKNLGGGLAAWSIAHPIGVVMITLALMVLGLFSLGRLGVDLLPHIIYPEVRVRVIDPGVPASIMEDRITRQLEEQLAITEDAVHVRSETNEGRSSVDLAFEYGKDIDIALRDASTRLDRAKRFLPDTIDPPVIYKRDPSQRPAAEYVVSSDLRDPVELRTWVDYTLGPWLLNLPGVAAAEVGGGLVREIQVLADQQRLAGLGMDVLDLAEILEQGNVDTPGGRLLMRQGEISGRTAGRFSSVEEVIALPLIGSGVGNGDRVQMVRLREVAQVVDGSEDERLRVRLNDLPGVKLSIQKQPQANTVRVVEAVEHQLAELEADGLIPDDIRVHPVDDQAIYIRNALRNAVLAALSGAVLAMLVVYLFLGSARRTLIIGSSIPIAVLFTFILMSLGGLTLNIMTLGGLALGIGMLVDNTIVMLENTYRHQRQQAGTGFPAAAARQAAAEVNSAIVASTSTNLAAVLPFLFIGGLVGLLFRELIFTISSAIVASMLVALTLVPALAGRIPARREGLLRRGMNRVIEALQNGYAWLISKLLKLRWLVVLAFVGALTLAIQPLLERSQEFLPEMDEGRVRVSLTADRGVNLTQMDAAVAHVEALLSKQPEVDSWFSQVGGFIFGRSQHEAANRASIQVRLKPLAERGGIASKAWVGRINQLLTKDPLAGVKVNLRVEGLRGIRFNRGDDDISLRVQGPELAELERIADRAVEALRELPGLRNLEHSAEELNQELSVMVDRDRAAAFGLSVEDVGRSLQLALGGIKVTEYLEGGRSFDLRLRLDRRDVNDPEDIRSVVLFSNTEPRAPLRLGDLARIELIPTPANIRRDRQQRVIDIEASLGEDITLEQASHAIQDRLERLALPPGYRIYDAGSLETLQEGRSLGQALLGLALFLVFVVMAVQYESLRDPLVIILSVPFALIGVVLGLEASGLPLSMPIWLGLIMLAGIVVNNAIVLVEYIEIERARGRDTQAAIVEAARLRLRPILMATLTTVVGMLPLALGLGEGAEMLQPLAVTIVSGLSFSMLVSLILVPCVYRLIGRNGETTTPVEA